MQMMYTDTSVGQVKKKTSEFLKIMFQTNYWKVGRVCGAGE